MRTLMWFRSDLRVDDNAALSHACKDEDDGVVALFAITPAQWREHDWGGTRVNFLLRNLAQLAERLATLNIPLKIIEAPAFDGLPEALVRLARECSCDAIYFNDEYEVNERQRDEAVVDAFEEAVLETHRFTDRVMLEPGLPRTGQGGFYSVFTPYKRKWLSHYTDVQPETHATPRPRAPISVQSDDVPASIDGFTGDVDDDRWPVGEKAAKLRLSNFLRHHVDEYEQRRNLPGIDGTSTLSPYLAIGVLSPRQCMSAAMEANGGTAELDGEGAACWMNELVWREFYTHVLVGFPRVCMDRAFKPETDRLRWSDDDEAFSRWCEGSTGFPIVDAGMRQLNATGWMHNRLRMIVAMFLTKDLFIDWRRGERYFAQRLIDLDFASNNGGWQWSASTGTDAQPYFRVFNPFSQSKRYDPDGAYIKEWVPELGGVPAKALHDEKKLAQAIERCGADYPAPMIDRSGTKDRVVRAFKALKD